VSDTAVCSGVTLGRAALAALLFAFTFTYNPTAAMGEQGLSGPESEQLMTEALHILGGYRSRGPRWTDTLRVAVVGAADTETIQSIQALFGELSILTGLDYRLLQHQYAQADQYLVAVSNSPRYDLALCNGFKKLECANFVVIVASQPTMHQITLSIPMRKVFQNATLSDEQVACFFSPGVSANGEIRRSIVFVNSSLDSEMLKTCLQEEIVQSFGLFNDYSGSEYFSFNNVVDVKRLTRFDKTLLSSLYDRSLPTGPMAALVVKEVVDYCRLNC
jgi:hypothetical protein